MQLIIQRNKYADYTDENSRSQNKLKDFSRETVRRIHKLVEGESACGAEDWSRD